MRQFSTAHRVVRLLLLLLPVSGTTLAQESSRPAVEFTIGVGRQTVTDIGQTTYTGIHTSAGFGAQVSHMFTFLFGIGYSSCRLDRQDRPYVTYATDTFRLDTARLYDAGAGSITIGATVKTRLIADSSARFAPYVHGRFGWYDSWHTSLRIGQGLDDFIVTGHQTYFGGGFGLDYLPRPETDLFVELTILRGQSNHPELSLLAISVGTRVTL